jgi:hypothetical protein
MLEERAIYFYIILLFTLGGLIWGLLDTRRIIEAPFLYATGATLILMPQLYIAACQGEKVPNQAYSIFCFMVILCSVALYFGYFSSSPCQRRKATYTKLYLVKPRALYILGSCTAMAGTVGVFQLRSYGTVASWRGWPVYWVTLATLIVPGITLMMVAYFNSPSLSKFVPVIFFTYFPFEAVMNHGRRTPALTLPLVFLVPLLLYRKNLRIPRWFIILGLTCAFVVVYAFPKWRDHLEGQSYAQRFRDHPPSAILDELFTDSRREPLETLDGMIVVGATYVRGNYQWGTGIYNMMIQNYVPGSLLGYELKDSLFLGNGIGQQWVTEIYAIPVAFYTSKSGYEDLFSQFSFFGCIVLYFLGRGFRLAHEAAIQRRDARAIIFLSFFASVPAGIAYSSLTAILSIAVPEILLILLAFKFCVLQLPLMLHDSIGIPELASSRGRNRRLSKTPCLASQPNSQTIAICDFPKAQNLARDLE